MVVGAAFFTVAAVVGTVRGEVVTVVRGAVVVGVEWWTVLVVVGTEVVVGASSPADVDVVVGAVVWEWAALAA